MKQKIPKTLRENVLIKNFTKNSLVWCNKINVDLQINELDTIDNIKTSYNPIIIKPVQEIKNEVDHIKPLYNSFINNQSNIEKLNNKGKCCVIL